METYTQKYCFPYQLIFTCTLYVISRKKIKETLPLVLFMIKAKTQCEKDNKRERNKTRFPATNYCTLRFLSANLRKNVFRDFFKNLLFS